ncbi:MAG: protein kinase domain-containing protein [Steroidobacter sp.]
MTRFHSALQSFLDGGADLPTVERDLRSALTREPSLVATLATQIETGHRSGRIAPPAYLSLMRIVRSIQPASAAPDETLLSNSDETRFHSVTPVVRADDEATRYRPASEEPRAADAPASSAGDGKSGPRSGGSTNPTWNDPAQWAGGESRALRPGDTVKDRFVLEEIIGAGGMGVVFRARDLRKEEAQDRHPYAALKVLNEDFKRHPESLKALQREARKAQNLAHPNIVTVYDFDRDGANVFMVMELLEGEPLDRLIRGMNGVGFSIDKALPIIRALCGALAYAHEHGVVHSDFKPANAYVTRSGAIKVFDFGIARAARRQGDLDTAGDKTLFDPGSLGALTPAYASCEMLEGLDPDPRDDVYALGCVVYELLTGAHPYDRKPAVQARDAKLKPRPVRGLTRRQWWGLRRALAFERSARIAGVAKFLEEISPEPRSPALWAGAAAVVLVLGATAALLLPDYLQRRHAAQLAALIRSGAEGSIEQALPEIHALPPDARAAILLDDDLRSTLIERLNRQIEAATDASQRKYDYPHAEALIAQLKLLFPDSQAVAQIGDRLMTRKNDEIKLQSDRFDEYLRKGWLVDGQNAENISAVLALIAQIDAAHPLLADPRLPSAYAEQAQLAIRQSDIPLAQALVTAGLASAPADSTLKDLSDVVNRELDTQRRAARLADLKRNLSQGLSSAATLAEFDAMRNDMSAMQSLAPEDAELQRLRLRLQALVDAEVESLVARRAYDDAQDLVAGYADLATPAYVESKRVALEGARDTSGAGVFARRDTTIAGLKSSLDALLKSPGADDHWDDRVRAQLARLTAYLPATDSYLIGARRDAANNHVATARELRAQSRLSEAERSLGRALAHAPEHEAVIEEQLLLTQVRAQQDSRSKEQKRVAELAALRQKLLDQATANEVAEATASLSELRASLAPNDPFLSTAGPRAIAGAYVRLAAVAARDGRIDSALTLIDRALEFDRTSTQTAALRERYVQQAGAQQAAAGQNPTLAKSDAPEPVSAPVEASTPPTGAAVESSTTLAASQAMATSGIASGAATAASTPASSASSCNSALAGYGTRSRGICFDALPTGRGPDLVVIPAGSGVARPFAMGRYEISAGEYNAFCRQAGACISSQTQLDAPMTSIAIADAQRYVEWLSAATGFVYRLPTDSEWVHAANAPGGGAVRDFNCVVEINGQKIRGFSLNNVRSGRANGWGLYNQVGNAQEWVKAADGWSARGGAYSDPISRCDATLTRASTGAADAITGFRVVRELR